MTSDAAPEWWVKALAEVAYGVRRNARGIPTADKWDLPGIRSAILALSANCSPADLARVMVNGADNPKLKTPAGVTAPGPQWGDTTRATTKAATPCPNHPDVPLIRCECQREQARNAIPKPENFRAMFDTARDQARADAAREREENRLEAQADFDNPGRAAAMAAATRTEEPA